MAGFFVSVTRHFSNRSNDKIPSKSLLAAACASRNVTVGPGMVRFYVKLQIYVKEDHWISKVSAAMCVHCSGGQKKNRSKPIPSTAAQFARSNFVLLGRLSLVQTRNMNSSWRVIEVSAGVLAVHAVLLPTGRVLYF